MASVGCNTGPWQREPHQPGPQMHATRAPQFRSDHSRSCHQQHNCLTTREPQLVFHTEPSRWHFGVAQPLSDLQAHEVSFSSLSHQCKLLSSQCSHRAGLSGQITFLLTCLPLSCKTALVVSTLLQAQDGRTKMYLSPVPFAEEQLMAWPWQEQQRSPKSRLSSQSRAAGDRTNLTPAVKRSDSFEWERSSFLITYELAYSELSQLFIIGFQVGHQTPSHSAVLTVDAAHVLVFYGKNILKQ